MQGHTIAIITNQRGVAFGFITMDDCDAKLNDVLRVFGLTSPRSDGSPPRPSVYCCVHDARGKPPYNDPHEAARAKPSGAMIREAMQDYPTAAARGVPFAWAGAFFQHGGKELSYGEALPLQNL